MQFLTAPQLICVEKNTMSLTLSHFGNLSIYNTLKPDLTLELLRNLRTKPKTVTRLASSIARHNRRELELELKRLVTANYVYALDGKSSARLLFKKNETLSFFIKEGSALTQLSSVISTTRIGIADFTGAKDNLKDCLKAVGFRKITAKTMQAGELNESFVRNHDFIIVMGDASHRLFFSKINQALLPHKKLWMLVTLDLFGGVVGPTFGAAGGPCYDCIIDQSKRHFDRQYNGSDYVDLIANGGNPLLNFSHHLLAKNVLPYVATEALKVLSKLVRPMTFEGFFTFDMFNFRMNYNVAHPSPTCPICSGL